FDGRLRRQWRLSPGPNLAGDVRLARYPADPRPERMDPMICVSIGRSRHKHMLAEHKHLVEQGAELVELRLDYISSRVNIQRLLKDRPCPTIITVRREQDGGKFTAGEDARLMMLREAI